MSALPPATNNALSPSQRVRLARSADKLSRVLGATPHFLDPVPPIQISTNEDHHDGTGRAKPGKPTLRVRLPIFGSKLRARSASRSSSPGTPWTPDLDVSRSPTPTSATSASMLITPITTSEASFSYINTTTSTARTAPMTPIVGDGTWKHAIKPLDAFRAHHPLHGPPLLRVASPTQSLIISPSSFAPDLSPRGLSPTPRRRGHTYTLSAPPASPSQTLSSLASLSSRSDETRVFNSSDAHASNPRDSYLDATPTFAILSPAAERRAKLARLQRKLGAELPASAVFELKEDTEDHGEGEVGVKDAVSGDMEVTSPGVESAFGVVFEAEHESAQEDDEFLLSDAELVLSDISSSDADSASVYPPTVESTWFDEDERSRADAEVVDELEALAGCGASRRIEDDGDGADDEGQDIFIPVSRFSVSTVATTMMEEDTDIDTDLVSPTMPTFARRASLAPSITTLCAPSPRASLCSPSPLLSTPSGAVQVVLQPPTPTRGSFSHGASASVSSTTSTSHGFRIPRKPVRYDAPLATSAPVSPALYSAPASPAVDTLPLPITFTITTRLPALKDGRLSRSHASSPSPSIPTSLTPGPSSSSTSHSAASSIASSSYTSASAPPKKSLRPERTVAGPRARQRPGFPRTRTKSGKRSLWTPN